MMHHFRFCLVILCSLSSSMKAESDELSELDKMLPDCRVLVVGLVKQHLKAFSACLKELKTTMDKEELASKMNCAVKCVLENSGLLNGEKKVTKATVQDFMDKNIPAVYHDISHDVSSHCYDEFGPQMDHDDEYCQAYGKFVECIQHVVSEIC